MVINGRYKFNATKRERMRLARLIPPVCEGKTRVIPVYRLERSLYETFVNRRTELGD